MFKYSGILTVALLQSFQSTSSICKRHDLSWPFNENTFAWKDADKFKINNSISGDEKGNWMAKSNFQLSGHTGTHLDAPYHFVPKGWKVTDIPLSNFFSTGVKIDLSGIASREAIVTSEHLIAWERKYRKIQKNAIILIYFDWSRYYNNRVQYLGGGTFDDYGFPSISISAAEWLVYNRSILGIGVDTASVDLAQTTDYPTHKTFLRNKVYILENLKIPKLLPGKMLLFGSENV
ncbi:hypothetical protein FQR65_LT12031 [Abscondita terminalis]|nr:hypothetical protein FQR65_LT12031 [Abscondita terminalis]